MSRNSRLQGQFLIVNTLFMKANSFVFRFDCMMKYQPFTTYNDILHQVHAFRLTIVIWRLSIIQSQSVILWFMAIYQALLAIPNW